MITVTRLAIVAVLLGLALVHASAQFISGGAFSRDDWLADYSHPKLQLEPNYSHLAWFGSPQGGVDLTALDRATRTALERASSNAEASAAITAFAAAFHNLAALIPWQKDVPARPQSKCSQIRYSTPDVSVRSYRLSSIEGQAVYASPSQKWELGSVTGVCVIIFDRKSRELVASVTTDDKGQFGFANIAPGEYVLTAFAGDLQKINIPIQLIPARKADKSQRLLLHLREKEDTRKSYVTPVTHFALRKELLAMIERDQNIRNEMIQAGVDHPSEAVLARMDVIDRRNTSRMKSIIKEYGWPGPSLVGWDGTEAAFFLVQHADHLTQKELLPLMQKEYRAGNLSGPNYALFTDRVLVEDGRKQIYGSRPRPFDQWEAGEPVFYPIEDEANVDKRRAEVGLQPLAEYRETLKRMYHPRSK